MSKLKITILILLLVAIIVGIVYIIKRPRVESIPRVSQSPASNPISPTPPLVQSTSTPSIGEEEAEVLSELQKIYETDKDLDGLSDTDEAKYNTSPTSTDTDNDGLMDRDEIQSYQTNPLKADTDGDGYKDGYEVRRGYSPKGKGRL